MLLKIFLAMAVIAYLTVAVKLFKELDKAADALQKAILGEGKDPGFGYDLLVILMCLFWPALFLVPRKKS